MKPECKIINASKTLVDGLIAMNTENRHLRKTVVDKYKRDIISGKWYLTNQGIGVSDDGVLIDGQHRLHAIKECGYPAIPILLVTGLDKESQKAVDQQSKRSARDMLAFSFSARVSRQAPAIAAALFRYQTDWRLTPTNQELYDVIIENMSEIDRVVSTPASMNFYAAPFLAAFVLYCKNWDADKTIEFMNRVEIGEMLTKEMPEFHLRNFIVTNRKGSGGGSMQKERFAKCMKALSAYSEGRKMGVLKA
jgi:hypothetical protein